MSDVPWTASITARDLVDAVKTVGSSLEHAPIDVLRRAHDMVYNHYMAVTRAAAGTGCNEAEQRVLGMLWAELELAIDQRGAREL